MPNPTSQGRSINEGVTDIVNVISEVGPEIGEISRRLNQFRETVRHRYKRFILGNNMSVHAMVDYEKIGLTRAALVMKFPRDLADPRELLARLGAANYVGDFEKVLTQNRWVVSLNLPAGKVPDLSSILSGLKRRGTVEDVSVLLFDSYNVPPMKAEYFDFINNRWDYDWSQAPAAPQAESASSPCTPVFDPVDLIIIKELQKDANRQLADMQVGGVNYKTLTWHYREHVRGRGLISGYRVNWLGTRWIDALDKAAHRQHVFLRVDLLVHEPTETGKAFLGEWASKTPFLWSEAIGKDYMAKFAFPVDHTHEGLEMLGKMTEPVRDQAEVLLMDQESAVSYSITPELYEEASKSWKFDGSELVEAFERAMPEAQARTKKNGRAASRSRPIRA